MVGEVFNELTVEISKAKEGLHFPFVCRLWPFRYSCYFNRVHFHMVFSYDKNQILDPRPLKLALLGPEEQLVFRKPSEHSMHDPMVFIQRLGEN